MRTVCNRELGRPSQKWHPPGSSIQSRFSLSPVPIVSRPPCADCLDSRERGRPAAVPVDAGRMSERLRLGVRQRHWERAVPAAAAAADRLAHIAGIWASSTPAGAAHENHLRLRAAHYWRGIHEPGAAVPAAASAVPAAIPAATAGARAVYTPTGPYPTSGGASAEMFRPAGAVSGSHQRVQRCPGAWSFPSHPAGAEPVSTPVMSSAGTGCVRLCLVSGGKDHGDFVVHWRLFMFRSHAHTDAEMCATSA